MHRRSIIGRAMFCSVCTIFNHAAKHTQHVERALKLCTRLRLSFAQLTYIPHMQNDIIPAATILRTLRRHPAQKLRPVLKNHRFQYGYLYKTKRPNTDPDHDNPQSQLTHVLHNFDRSLNIPSSQHLLTNLHPTAKQQHNRYTCIPSLVTPSLK